jgi:hypothetical protein
MSGGTGAGGGRDPNPGGEFLEAFGRLRPAMGALHFFLPVVAADEEFKFLLAGSTTNIVERHWKILAKVKFFVNRPNRADAG